MQLLLRKKFALRIAIGQSLISIRPTLSKLKLNQQYMTIAHLDFLLAYFYTHTDDYSNIKGITEYMISKNEFRNVSTLECLLTTEKLVRDGYVTEEKIQNTTIDGKSKVIKDRYSEFGYFISFEGIELYELGGYAALNERNEEKKIYAERKMQLEVESIQASTRTNEAVRENIPVQKRQTTLTIIVGSLSLIFIAVSTVQSYGDNSSKEIRGIKEQLEKSQAETLRLRESIQKAGESLQKLRKIP